MSKKSFCLGGSELVIRHIVRKAASASHELGGCFGNASQLSYNKAVVKDMIYLIKTCC